MTQLRLDGVQFTSSVDMYLNYNTLYANLNISGSVADGATAVFTTSIPYNRSKTRADVYARNTTTNIKIPTSNGVRVHPYVPSSGETATLYVRYTGTQINIQMEIFNGTGGPIGLIAQTLEMSAVLYEVPYTQ